MNDLSREARALIEDARPAERPAPSAKSRVRAALAAQLAGPPAPPSQAHGPLHGSTAIAGAGTKVLLACALTVAGLLGGVAAHRAMSRGPTTSTGAAPSSPVAPVPPPPAPNEPSQLPAVHAPPTAAALARGIAPATRPSAPSKAPAPRRLPTLSEARPASSQQRQAPGEPQPATPLSPVAEVGCTAKQELGLLAAAQVAVREGRAKVALATLDQHAARCPAGRFREEHSTLHILALCLLHRREQAQAEAAALATLAPTSPQLVRLRTSCAAAAVEKVARGKAPP